MYFDEVLVWDGNVAELLASLAAALERLEAKGLFAAAHKGVFYTQEVKVLWKFLLGTIVRHDSERTKRLMEKRRLETVGEMVQLLQAVNWMRLSLPKMARDCHATAGIHEGADVRHKPHKARRCGCSLMWTGRRYTGRRDSVRVRCWWTQWSLAFATLVIAFRCSQT